MGIRNSRVRSEVALGMPANPLKEALIAHALDVRLFPAGHEEVIRYYFKIKGGVDMPITPVSSITLTDIFKKSKDQPALFAWVLTLKREGTASAGRYFQKT